MCMLRLTYSGVTLIIGNNVYLVSMTADLSTVFYLIVTIVNVNENNSLQGGREGGELSVCGFCF